MKTTCWTLVGILLLGAAGMAFAGGSNETSSTTMAAASTGQKTPVVDYRYFPQVGTDAELQHIQAYIEDKSGVKFEARYVKNADDYTAQIQVTLASQEPVDIIDVNGQSMQDYMNRGVIQKLNDVIDKYGPHLKKQVSADVWKSVTVPDGSIWAFPTQRSPNTGVVLSIRKDWREKLGMPPITTVQQLETYLQRVKTADFDGDGKADTIPLLGYYNFDGIEETIEYAFTGSYGAHKETGQHDYMDSQGNIVPTVMNPAFKDYLATMAKWYKEGLIYQDQVSFTGGQQGNDLIAANRVGAVASWYSDFYTGWQQLVKTVPSAEYEIVVLKGPNGEPAKFNAGVPGAPGEAIVSYSKNAEWATKLFDWLVTSKENYLTEVHGVPNVDWTWVDQATNTIDKKDPTLYAYALFGYWPWNGRFGNPNWRQEKYLAANDFLLTQSPYYPPDWFVAYNFKNTPIESANADAATLINEGIANIIIGRRPVSDWDSILAQYKKMYGDEYVKLATAQYKAYK